MRKRLLTYSLAVAMAVAMAVPQTVILPTSTTQVQAADENAEIKATPTAKNVVFSTMDSQDCIQFDELKKWADDKDMAAYTANIKEVFVNEKRVKIIMKLIIRKKMAIIMTYLCVQGCLFLKVR